MQTRQRKSRPRKGEYVYQGDAVEGDQPNGRIIYVNHDEREVIVEFFVDGTKSTVPRHEDYSFDDLAWTDSFKGMWLVGE